MVGLVKQPGSKIAQVLECGGNVVGCEEGAHIESGRRGTFPSDEASSKSEASVCFRKPHYSSSQAKASYDIGRVVQAQVDSATFYLNGPPKSEESNPATNHENGDRHPRKHGPALTRKTRRTGRRCCPKDVNITQDTWRLNVKCRIENRLWR